LETFTQPKSGRHQIGINKVIRRWKRGMKGEPFSILGIPSLKGLLDKVKSSDKPVIVGF